jgi:hypothetical protein
MEFRQRFIVNPVDDQPVAIEIEFDPMGTTVVQAMFIAQFVFLKGRFLIDDGQPKTTVDKSADDSR